MMLPTTLALVLAVTGQATAAFTIGHRVNEAYVETESTAGIKHDYSASQAKLVVATRTLGDLTYTFLSAAYTGEPATTNGLADVTALAASSTMAAAAAVATETHHITLTTVVTLTVKDETSGTPTTSQPSKEMGDLPFHVHGGGAYTSIAFYGSYGAPVETTSTALAASSTELPYYHSIITTQPPTASMSATTFALSDSAVPTSSVSAVPSASAPALPSASVSSAPAVSTTSETPSAIPTSSLPLFPSTAMASSSSLPTSSLPSTSLSSPSVSSPPVPSPSVSSMSSSAAASKPATTLSGLTVPAGSATATDSPKAVETHIHSGGSCSKTAMSTVLLFMAVAHMFALP